MPKQIDRKYIVYHVIYYNFYFYSIFGFIVFSVCLSKGLMNLQQRIRINCLHTFEGHEILMKLRKYCFVHEYQKSTFNKSCKFEERTTQNATSL